MDEGGVERYVKVGSENGQLSPEGPRWGTWRGVHLLGTLRYSNIWAPFLGPRGC